MQDIRFIQSRACPAIIGVIRNGVAMKITVANLPREWWDKGPPEAPAGTRFNYSPQCWEDLAPGREREAWAALQTVLRHHLGGPGQTPIARRNLTGDTLN